MTIEARIVQSRDDLVAPGAIKFEFDDCLEVEGITFLCPCGCGELAPIPVRGPANGTCKGWDFDGNRQRPTLYPSILKLEPDGRSEHWHGFLTAGAWIPC